MEILSRKHEILKTREIIPELIGSRFRVQGSKVTTDWNCVQFCSRSEIPDITHWVARLYNHDEGKIPLAW